MPISIDRFHELGEEGDDPEPTNAEKVVGFLARNRDKAFKAQEIAEGAEVHRNSIHPVLKRLRERGLVEHKEPYWAIGDMERVREAWRYHQVATFLDEVYGPEDRDTWLEAAVEPS